VHRIVGCLLLVAVAECVDVSMLDDANAMSQALAQAQGDLEKAWKQRDDALAQVKSMRAALKKKCGVQAATVADKQAKIASDKLKEARAQAVVAADQSAAKAEADKANKAMAVARSAVADKEKAKAALKAAQESLKKMKAEEKTVNAQSRQARAAAKKLAEGGGSDAAVKDAYAKASSLYAKVMDAKMRREMAKKRVEELGGTASKAADKAKKELIGAKGYTKDAASKVRAAMKAQVKAAREKHRIAAEKAKAVRAQEASLLKESNSLQEKIKTARTNTQKAADAMAAAKLEEQRALEAVKLPEGASPEEAAAFQKAKMKVFAEQSGQSANYAAKIKNIETSLLDAKEKVRVATEKKGKLEKEKLALSTKLSAEKDSVQQVKLKKKITALEGAMKMQDSIIKTSKEKLDSESKAQNKEIASVVKGVVLQEDDGEAKATKELEVATAQKAVKGKSE